MPRLLLLFIASLSLLPVRAQEPQLTVGQTFLLRIAEVPKAEQEQITGIYKIGAKGMVAFPYLKLPLQLAGLKPSEVEAAVAEAYHEVGLSSARISIVMGCAPEERNLKVGETVTIRFSGIPPEDLGDWGISFTVSDSGEIKLPHLKPMQVIECTPSELSVKIAKTYRDQKIWSNLVATVRIQDRPIISVTGGVRHPGEVSFRAGINLHTAITKCGGFTDDNVRRIKLIRGKTEQIIDLKKLPTEPLVLQPGDQIVVPEG